MYQQLWGYKVEEKLYLGVREQKRVEYHWFRAPYRKMSDGVRSDDLGGYSTFFVF
jgi:hypothetical protein